MTTRQPALWAIAERVRIIFLIMVNSIVAHSEVNALREDMTANRHAASESLSW